MQIKMYSQDGAEAGMYTLNSAFFEVPWKAGLVHQALLRQLAGGRKPIAHTKTRADRRGGGKKPWKQKHTGRARVGSNRSPIWRKGGVIFGPRGVENYQIRMPQMQRILATLSALSQKAREEKILGLESFALETPKTKTFATLLKKLPVERSTLIVTGSKNASLEKSVRNLPHVKLIPAQYLNVADLMHFRSALFTKDSFDTLEKMWGAHAKKLAGSDSRKEADKTSKGRKATVARNAGAVKAAK